MKNYFWLLCFCLFLTSCQQQEHVVPLNIANQANEVPSEMASTIAKNFSAIFAVTPFKGESRILRINNIEKTVKEITPFSDDTGKPLYYVINYNEGGFVIVSAEKRTMPILAFSETNIFPVDKEFPNGVKETMNTYSEGIKKIRTSTSAADSSIIKEWARLEDTDAINESVKKTHDGTAKSKSEPVDEGCQDSQMYVTLATAAWGQGSAWNSQMPQQNTFGCTGMPSGRAWTGCVATSMAIVMNFHDFPNTYNWGAMGAYQSETARLMKDAAGGVNMVYECGGSWAYGTAIAPGLINSFGYSASASYSSYNVNKVTGDILNWSRPVILCGSQSGIGGHAWVCDGFYQYFPCDSGGQAPMLYMNWGWNGISNGFYSTSTSFVPSGQSTPFSNLHMVFSIRP